MDRLRAMEVFTKVVETGSFTAAAHALRIPRATATTLVQALEARLQLRLLHRTTRRVAPSAEGAVFYEEASRLLRDLEALEAGLGDASVGPRGRVRVDVPAAAGRHLIAPALPQFFARFPEVTVELGSGDRPVDLLGEGLDCVIRGGELHDESLVARKLGELPVLTFASPAYLRERGAPTRPDDLGDHVFVGFFSPRTGRVFDVDFAGDVDVALPPPHRVAANDTETWVALAVAGLGLLQAPCGKGIRAHALAGELAPVLTGWRSEPLPVYAMYPRSRRLPARTRAFVDWVAELFAEECRLAEAFVAEIRRSE